MSRQSLHILLTLQFAMQKVNFNFYATVILIIEAQHFAILGMIDMKMFSLNPC